MKLKTMKFFPLFSKIMCVNWQNEKYSQIKSTINSFDNILQNRIQFSLGGRVLLR